MSRNVRDVIAELPDDQRSIVEKRAAELIAEEMTLRELSSRNVGNYIVNSTKDVSE